MASNEIKIKLSIDGKEATATLDLSDQKIQKMISSTKQASGEMNSSLATLKNMAGALGLAFGARELFTFAKDAVYASAELEVLKKNFQGTAADIELFKKATAGTVSEGTILKLSNQATDLGLSMQDQAKLFYLAEEAGDKYGSSLEEGFQRVVKATEGQVKGLAALGLQKAVYNEIVDRLAKTEGDAIEKLEPEIQKRIRIQAVLEATGVTMEKVNNQLADSKDKLEQLGVAWESVKVSFGDVLRKGTYELLYLIGAVASGEGIFKAIQMQKDEAAKLRDKFLAEDYSKEATETATEEIKNKTKADLKKMYEDQKKLVAYLKLPHDASPYDMQTKTDKEITLAAEEAKLKVYEAAATKRKIISDKELKERDQILKSYYDTIKFLDADYWDYRMGMIEKESDKMKQSGIDSIKIERFQIEEKKKLNSELSDWIKKDFAFLFDKEGKIIKGITIPINFQISGGPLIGKIGNQKPEMNFGSAEQILEGWVRGSKITGDAIDGFINGAMDGFDTLKIKVSQDANIMSKAFGGFANAALQAIEQILAKWAILNVFSFLGGLPGINLFSMLGLAEGGVINEPIAGIGASGTKYLLGEKESELVIPLSKLGNLNNIGNSAPMKIDVTVGGELTAKGSDLRAVIRRLDKLEKLK